MQQPRGARRSRAAWLLLAAAAVASLMALVMPGTRSPAAVVASVLAPVLVVVGLRVNRHRSLLWCLLALMLALWGAGDVAVQLRGRIAPLDVALVSAGQLVAAVVVVRVARTRSSDRDAATGNRVDLLLIATVLGLVVAQLVAASAAGGDTLSTLVVPTVDVAILGILLRFVVSRDLLQTSAYVLLVAAVLTTVYDLSSALQGHRLALPGEPAQALGVLCLLLFGIAAIHPSMTSTFERASMGRRRAGSTSLLGLLPLVVVPVALWWVAEATGSRGLPTWALLLAGALVAGLSLVRASGALRASEHLADHDPLTDLANRRGLARTFGQGGDGVRSVLLIDIDEFKAVNDTHGHDVGDRLLLHVRDRLLRVAGDTGTVARLGGDEFVILTTGSGQQTAGRALAALKVPAVVDGLVLRVSASVGIAVAGPGDDLAELLTRADVAMYAAKASGRDAAMTFRPEMRLEVARRFALTNDVRLLLGAPTNDVGQLEIHYQPLVELGSAAVVGAEALVRWRHPRHGLLSPDAFLGAVSSTGLDVHLDDVVLRTVLEQVARWEDEGLQTLPVSVNLTRDSLGDPDLAERVLTALARTGVPPALLHVEITEHEELPEDSPAEHTLRTLAEAGVHTHLDDYGVGYTSLDYLRRFPVTALKLDRSVVSSLGAGRAPVVAGVTAMARALDLELVAEGVETDEQRQQLAALGVRFGQGYLFARPLPADDFARVVLGPPVEPPAAVPSRSTAA